MELNISECSSSNNADSMIRKSEEGGNNFSGSVDLAKLFGKTIAVDLTPLLPGGKNGGAKLVALQLVKEMAHILPDTTFVLLTSEISHFELEEIDSHNHNIKRICVLKKSPILQSKEVPNCTFINEFTDIIKAFGRKVMTPSMKKKIKRLLWSQKFSVENKGLLYQIGVDLLFCPFTVPVYADIRIPTVSIIHDLQYRTYPQFFSDIEVIQREEGFKLTCQKADHIITISEFVKNTILANSGVSPENITVIKHGLFLEEENIHDKKELRAFLKKYNLTKGEYLLFPANFWEHKNHAMLLTAFSIYRKSHPNSKLKLVCTGEPNQLSEKFLGTINKMGLSDWVIYPGFVSSREYNFLLESAYALIFPSLYEGFGLPVLEAMSKGIPVLCSNVSSLPEVGGDAVLYFDPRKPADICNAIESLEYERGLYSAFRKKGKQRAQLFTNLHDMTENYISVISNTLFQQDRSFVSGLYQDNWTADAIIIRFSRNRSDRSRKLMLSLENPKWTSIGNTVRIKINCNGSQFGNTIKLKPGKNILLEIPLQNIGGLVEIKVSPTFNPNVLGINNDSRNLGLICKKCEISSEMEIINLLK